MAEMRFYTMQDYVDRLSERGMLQACELQGKGEMVIKNLTYNSKEVSEDTLFICKGAAFKPVYLRESIEKGAVAYISEKIFELDTEVPYILARTDIALRISCTNM